GTFGTLGPRSRLVTASNFTLPATTCGCTVISADKRTWMRPSPKSFTAWTGSRYGTLIMLRSAPFRKPEKTKSVAPVTLNQLSLPSWERTNATSSASEPTFSDEGTLIEITVLVTRAIGTNSY